VFPVRYELECPHSVCVPYGSHNKQRLFPQTALTGWALQRRRNVFPVRYELDLHIRVLLRRVNEVYIPQRLIDGFVYNSCMCQTVYCFLSLHSLSLCVQ
jgi:hypothetical protein